MALSRSFDKEYNIAILSSKKGQNFNQKLFDNQTLALTKWESKFSVGSLTLSRPSEDL